MTRRPIFWLAFVALGSAGVAVSVTLFSTALPSISVDIRMGREAAMDSAAALAERYAWGAASDRSAATFGLDDDLVQTYVELEGGGRDVVERLAERNVYEAYQWRVRRFAEARVEESWTRFTPAGEPYGFLLTLAEDDPGASNPDAIEARGIAETTASEWGVDLGLYRLLESSSQTLPSGRVDHTFVYERTDERIGEARFRLRLVVAGDRPSELTHFVSVPEAFSRRYSDMRSTNDSIAIVAQAVLLLVFALLGAGVGSALLLRARWLEWRPPLKWAAAIAVLYGAATVNQLPLSWTAYDTALSSTSFVLQQVAGGAAVALLGTPLLAFFLMAGESLGRRAFPGHVQQWRFWTPPVASSNTALGMTLAAYLLVGLQVGYVVLFYLGTQRLEGWWSPADALVQPDLLATYQPWLEAVSLAFLASFWEESLFRAVPIACAALLGARFGRKGLWIWGAVILQAVVFAAGHANYPQQPPYARVIELTAPALLWGSVYVFFGLVPTILAHFLYDLSLISLVLFESEAHFDQAVIVVVALAPLAVVLGARWRHRARAAPPDDAYNGAWSPPARAVPAAGPEIVSGPREGAEGTAAPPSPAAGVASSAGVGSVTGVGAGAGRHGGGGAPPAWSVWAALALAAVATVVAALARPAPPPLWGDRAAAVAAATEELEARGVRVSDWDVMVSTAPIATEGREYVFQEAGSEAFSELEGSYFGIARWIVRLVRWDAEPEARVEEYVAWVGADGRVQRVRHTLPEAEPGASLDVDAARRLARDALSRRFALSGDRVREVEAEETSRPDRTDWLLTFAEVDRLTDVEGEVRFQVRIVGDEVADVASTIHVPEEWERERRRVESRNRIMGGGFSLLILIGFAAAAVVGVVVWSRGALPTSVLWKLSGASFVAWLASLANDWPYTVASFSTSQPWSFQAGATLIGLVLAACLIAPVVGLVGALAHAWIQRARTAPASGMAGPAFGVMLSGLSLLAWAAVPRPVTGGYLGAASAVPVLSSALSTAPVFLLLTSALLVVIALRLRFRDRTFVASTLWSLVLAASVVLVPNELQGSIWSWGIATLAVAAGLSTALYVCSSWPIVVPGFVAGVLGLRTLFESWPGPYAGARIGGLIALVALVALAWAWTRELARASASADQSRVETRASRASVGSE